MRKVKFTALGISLLALSGCQSFPFHLGMQESAAPSAPDMSSYFVQRLNDGKRHLEAHRLAAAIDAFRHSSYHPEYAGEAYNGMAIAYDRLGRYDLAETYFNRAVEAAPDDPRFARNASRFQNMMLARAGVMPETVEAHPQPIEELAQADLELERLAEVVEAEVGPPPPPRMQRVSAGEVTIASRQDWTARAASIQPARPAVVHIGRPSGNATRLAAGTSTGYPLRFAIADIPTDRNRGADEAHGSTFTNVEGEVRVRVSGQLRPQDRPAYPISFRLDPPS